MTNFPPLSPVNKLENVQTLKFGETYKCNNLKKSVKKMPLNSWCAQQAWNLDSFIWWSFHSFSLRSDLNSRGTTSRDILALSLFTVGSQKYRNEWNGKIMENKSQSKSFFSLFLFPLVNFLKQMCLTFSQSLGSSFSSVIFFSHSLI